MCNAKADVRAANCFQRFERYIELVRCQDNVLAMNKVADYLFSSGLDLLVVRAAGKHEKSPAEI